jgi:hypothetical protein
MLRPMFATALLASSLFAGQVQAQMASKPFTNDDLLSRVTSSTTSLAASG